MKNEKKRTLTIIILPAIFIMMVLLVLLFWDGFRKFPAKEDEETKQVELNLVYAYQNTQWNSAIEKIVDDFEELYPDIKINYEVNYEHKVYEDILSKRIARNELGDIVQLKTPEPYAKSGMLGKIPEEEAELSSLNYTYDGEVYGIGAVRATTGIIYNKKIFADYGLQEPQTYQEFLDICDTLKRRGVTPIGVAGSDLWHMEYWVNHFFRTEVLIKNENWLQECTAGTVSWTDEQPAAMLQHLMELFDSGYVNENWLATADGNLAYRMSEGEIAMLYTGPWTAATIGKLNPDMKLGWFYVPDENGNICAGNNEDTFWAVTAPCAADEKKYESAMTFLRYFYSQESYMDLCQSTYTFSLLKGKHSYGEVTDIQEDVYESFQNADCRISVYIGNEDTPEEFEKSMLTIIQQVLDHQISTEAGLEEIQKVWERLGGQEAAS